jgi:hypothetical protein
MLDDVLFAEDGEAADLAVELPDGQGERRIVKNGAVRPVVQRMKEFQVASAAI